MKRIDVDDRNNEAKLLVDTRFYGYGSVLLSAKAFSNDCWVYVDGDMDSKMLVCLKPKTEEIDVETVGFEFYNYLLGLMQNARC